MNVNSFFLISEAKLPVRALHHKAKKKHEYNVCYALGLKFTVFIPISAQPRISALLE